MIEIIMFVVALPLWAMFTLLFVARLASFIPAFKEDADEAIEETFGYKDVPDNVKPKR